AARGGGGGGGGRAGPPAPGRLFTRRPSLPAGERGAALLALGLASSLLAAGWWWGPYGPGALAEGRPWGDEVLAGAPYLLREDGGRLWTTGRLLRPGDRWSPAARTWYRIVRLAGRTAWATRVAAPPAPGAAAPPGAAGGVREALAAQVLQAGLYATHDDERYAGVAQGTGGAAGGPADVRQAAVYLAERLRAAGVPARVDLHSHLPHDRGAYRRSRRSAVALLARAGSTLLLDLHRDPAAQGRAQVPGLGDAAPVVLVVGRADPHAAANLAFARQLRALAARRYPGLVRGILFSGGNYNQDLSPFALLVELGGADSRPEEVARSADALARLLAEWGRRRLPAAPARAAQPPCAACAEAARRAATAAGTQFIPSGTFRWEASPPGTPVSPNCQTMPSVAGSITTTRWLPSSFTAIRPLGRRMASEGRRRRPPPEVGAYRQSTRPPGVTRRT
ncbi:MAG: stage II sporulation protein P, partial [Clostridia bacterium]|nr:stage II sporulation protein P [Clostridia bacterium]